MNFLDIDGLVEYCYLSRATIYRHIKNNSIPSIKIGRRRLFDRAAIDIWLRNCGDSTDELPAIRIIE
jgi:excisionase family DNA binding protein